MGRQSFGNDKQPAILKRLQRLYGQLRLGELDTALLHLKNPMDRYQPVDVILWVVEEFKIFLLAHPEADLELADTNLISYALIKLNNTGSMELANLKTWATFRKHIIAEF